MKLSKEQEKALENYVIYGSMSLSKLKEILKLNVKNDQLLGLELIKLAHNNKEEFSLMIGIYLVCKDNHPINFKNFSFIKSIYFSEWHHEHENIIDTFSRIISCDYIDFLFEAIKFVPQYQIGVDEHSIARRAFFGLGRNIACPKALQYLKLFQHDSDPVLRMFADEQYEILKRDGLI